MGICDLRNGNMWGLSGPAFIAYLAWFCFAMLCYARILVQPSLPSLFTVLHFDWIIVFLNVFHLVLQSWDNWKLLKGEHFIEIAPPALNPFGILNSWLFFEVRELNVVVSASSERQASGTFSASPPPSPSQFSSELPVGTPPPSRQHGGRPPLAMPGTGEWPKHSQTFSEEIREIVSEGTGVTQNEVDLDHISRLCPNLLM